MEDKITLDRESFRSLASGTRVSILKSLDRRRKMLTELAKELKMSPSTVKEHMDNLCSAELTVQIDDGHKWKYYELTRKGKNILHPEDTKIWILLSISAFAIIGIFYDMLRSAAGGMTFAAQKAAPLGGGAADSFERAAEPMLEAPSLQAASQALPYFHIIGLIAFAVLLGSCIAYLAMSRKKGFLRI
jgi:predicted ArsR family transcriptional regulator